MAVAETGGRAVSRSQTLAAVVAAAGIVQLPSAAIVVALPTIHSEFNASIAELQWTVTAYYIPQAAMLIASGRIADIFGRKRMLLIGCLLFGLGSAIAAAAPDAQVLIAGIAIAGAAGALLMPASMSILTNVFTGERRGTAIGLWGGATELISGVGIVLGGFLTSELDWRWIFVIDIVVVAIIALLAWRGAPESSDPNASRDVDVPGVALLITALTALTLALVQGATWGWGSTAIIALLAAAVVLFVVFVVVERRSANPIISFDFFRRRNFTGATIVIFVLDFSFGALLFFLPLYFQEILGYDPVEAGVLLLPLTGLMVIGSPLGGRLAARVGQRPPIMVGLALITVSVYWISTLSLDTEFSDLWVPTSMMGFGVGISLTAMNLAAMNAISRNQAGAASGMLVTLSGLGATLGVAVTGAVFNQLNIERTAEEVNEKAGVTIGDAQAENLDGLLAGASDAQRTLDSIAGKAEASNVMDAVREAFVSSLGTSLKIAAALVLVGLILATILIRRQEPVDDDELTMPPVAAPPHRPLPRHPHRWGWPLRHPKPG